MAGCTAGSPPPTALHRQLNSVLPLQELSLLLGVNGIGKTSVLDVMFAVRRLLSGAGE